MTKTSMPVVMCDADDAMCGEWVADHYEMGASAVDGVRCTPVPPGWQLTDDDEHLCPRHAGGGRS